MAESGVYNNVRNQVQARAVEHALSQLAGTVANPDLRTLFNSTLKAYRDANCKEFNALSRFALELAHPEVTPHEVAIAQGIYTTLTKSLLWQRTSHPYDDDHEERRRQLGADLAQTRKALSPLWSQHEQQRTEHFRKALDKLLGGKLRPAPSGNIKGYLNDASSFLERGLNKHAVLRVRELINELVLQRPILRSEVSMQRNVLMVLSPILQTSENTRNIAADTRLHAIMADQKPVRELQARLMKLATRALSFGDNISDVVRINGALRYYAVGRTAGAGRSLNAAGAAHRVVRTRLPVPPGGEVQALLEDIGAISKYVTELSENKFRQTRSEDTLAQEHPAGDENDRVYSRTAA